MPPPQSVAATSPVGVVQRTSQVLTRAQRATPETIRTVHVLASSHVTSQPPPHATSQVERRWHVTVHASSQSSVQVDTSAHERSHPSTHEPSQSESDRHVAVQPGTPHAYSQRSSSAHSQRSPWQGPEDGAQATSKSERIEAVQERSLIDMSIRCLEPSGSGHSAADVSPGDRYLTEG